MTDNKLTDREIVKALECCGEMECSKCPMNYDDCEERDFDNLVKRAIPIFNRLQAENERLRKELETEKNQVIRLESQIGRLLSMNQAKLDTIHDLQEENNWYNETLNTTKAEAYKEFAERLKNEIISDTAYGCDTNQHTGYYDYQIKIGDIPEYIDNLLKELVGDIQ